jgi:hypothetical protein
MATMKAGGRRLIKVGVCIFYLACSSPITALPRSTQPRAIYAFILVGELVRVRVTQSAHEFEAHPLSQPLARQQCLDLVPIFSVFASDVILVRKSTIGASASLIARADHQLC